MYVHNSKTIGILAALVAICGLAAAALMHRSSSPAAAAITPGNALTQPGDMNTGYSNAGYSNSASTVSSYPAPAATYAAGSQMASSREDGYYSTAQRPVYVRSQEQIAPVNQDPRYVDRQYVNGPTTYSTTDRRYRTRTVYEERPVYRHGRSKEHSVEIVAGTAAAGAAIGAIAGGGKGAAIGALSGAGAGFAYDRLTHNH